MISMSKLWCADLASVGYYKDTSECRSVLFFQVSRDGVCRSDNLTLTLHTLPQSIVFMGIRKKTFNTELLKPSLGFVQ